MKRALFFLVWCALGCGTNTDVESQLTITQGLYGQLTQSCTGMGCVGTPRVGANVAWFERNPYETSDGGVKPMPISETTAGANGFYQFELAASMRGYLAVGENRTNGVQYFTSTSATIPRGLARIDWHAGPDNEGTWTDVR